MLFRYDIPEDTVDHVEMVGRRVIELISSETSNPLRSTLEQLKKKSSEYHDKYDSMLSVDIVRIVTKESYEDFEISVTLLAEKSIKDLTELDEFDWSKVCKQVLEDLNLKVGLLFDSIRKGYWQRETFLKELESMRKEEDSLVSGAFAALRNKERICYAQYDDLIGHDYLVAYFLAAYGFLQEMVLNYRLIGYQWDEAADIAFLHVSDGLDKIITEQLLKNV